MSPLKELIDEGNAFNPGLSNLHAAFTVLGLTLFFKSAHSSFICFILSDNT